MPELSTFDIKVCETIQNANPVKGAGITADELLDALEMEPTETNVQKLTESMRKLQKAQYVYKMAISENLPPSYFTTQRYWQERESYWMGPKYGRKPTKLDVPEDNPVTFD